MAIPDPSFAGYPLVDIRERFPALRITDNGVPRIYFDNPAGTQVTDSVVDAMRDCLVESNANVGGGFETSNRADQVIADAHLAMADFLNAASSEEIVFGQNMTTLTLHLSRSLGRRFEAGDEIILSRMCHDANVSPWLLLAEDLGLTVRWFEFNTETFEYEIDKLPSLINDRTKLICIGGASNLLGTINDSAAVTAIARDAGVMTYIDAVQLAPHVAIDVQALGCDFLVCSAYKFFGPHQGILYGRKAVLEALEPYKVRPASAALPWAFETGTQSHEGMAGTAAAVDYFAWIGESFAHDYQAANTAYPGRRGHIRAALQYLFDYETTLSAKLVDGLQAFKSVKIQGISDLAAFERRVPTVAFTVKGKEPAAIARELAGRNMFVWSGHNYALEVGEALDINKDGGAVRVGPVHYNSVAEIDRLLSALEEIL